MQHPHKHINRYTFLCLFRSSDKPTYVGECALLHDDLLNALLSRQAPCRQLNYLVFFERDLCEIRCVRFEYVMAFNFVDNKLVTLRLQLMLNKESYEELKYNYQICTNLYFIRHAIVLYGPRSFATRKLYHCKMRNGYASSRECHFHNSKICKFKQGEHTSNVRYSKRGSVGLECCNLLFYVDGSSRSPNIHITLYKLQL